MKKILFLLLPAFLNSVPASAIKLSELLTVRPVGREIGKWKASSFVPEHVVGKLFGVPSERGKVWQLRFFTFEDRNDTLEKKNSFADFVKKFELEDLQSKAEPVPYNDGTFQSFTYKEANEFLKEKGKEPLPEDIYFIISFIII